MEWKKDANREKCCSSINRTKTFKFKNKLNEAKTNKSPKESTAQTGSEAQQKCNRIK